MNEKFYSFFSRYGLVIVLIIAIFFRFYNLTITPPGLYPDEAMDGTNAQEALATAPPAGGFKVFYPENNGREGLFINIQAVFLKIFKVNEPWVLRSVSAIFGVLTIFGIYLLVYHIFRRRPYAHFAAFLPSFFTAVSFWHVNFSRISFRAIMAPAFMVWALYLLIVALEHLRSDSEYEIQNTRYKMLILSAIGGLIYGLGMHSYIAYRATPVIIIFVYLLYRWLYKIDPKKLFVSFVIFVTASLIAFAPLGIYFLKNPADFFGRTSELSVTASATPLKDLATNIIKTLGMFDIRGDGNWRHNFSGSPEIYWIAGIFFIIGILLGIKFIGRKKGDGIEQSEISEIVDDKEIKLTWLVSIAWLLTAMLPVVISNEGIPHALRSLLMVPPAYILAGLGTLMVTLFVFKKSRPAFVWPIMLLVAVTLIAQSYITYFILWANNPNVADAFSQPYVNIARELNQIGPSIKKYVVVNASGVLVREIPMPSQTIMFLTDTFTPDKQVQKNLYYILPGQEKNIGDKNSIVFYLEPESR